MSHCASPCRPPRTAPRFSGSTKSNLAAPQQSQTSIANVDLQTNAGKAVPVPVQSMPAHLHAYACSRSGHTLCQSCTLVSDGQREIYTNFLYFRLTTRKSLLYCLPSCQRFAFRPHKPAQHTMARSSGRTSSCTLNVKYVRYIYALVT